MTEPTWTVDDVLAAMEKGDLDWALRQITQALAERQQIVDRWQPITDLSDMVRRIDQAVLDSVEKRALLGMEMNKRLERDLLKHEDPVVRNMAIGVRQDIWIRLLGVPKDRVEGLSRSQAANTG